MRAVVATCGFDADIPRFLWPAGAQRLRRGCSDDAIARAIQSQLFRATTPSEKHRMVDVRHLPGGVAPIGESGILGKQKKEWRICDRERNRNQALSCRDPAGGHASSRRDDTWPTRGQKSSRGSLLLSRNQFGLTGNWCRMTR